MHPVISQIIEDFNPALLNQLDDALKLHVTNFKRDLFPSLEKIDLEIPGAGFQYVIWKGHEARYPFPGFEWDHISRPMKYIPTYLSSGMRFSGMARSIAHFSGGHLEDCIKAFCEKQLPSSAHKYMAMPLGKLTRQRILVELLGSDIVQPANDIAIVLVNEAKHEFRTGSPLPGYLFQMRWEAILRQGYWASRFSERRVFSTAMLRPFVRLSKRESPTLIPKILTQVMILNLGHFKSTC